MTKLVLAGALLAGLALAAPGCSGCDDTPGTDGDAGVDAAPDAYVPQYDDCSADGESFVRNAYQAILGHRPRSQAEVDVYTAIYDQVTAANQPGADGGVPATTADPREVVARAIMKESAYVDRWTSQLMDALRVQRIEDQTMFRCYNDEERGEVTDDLALYVRDNPGSAGGSGGPFTMLDLLKSSLVLDDLSPAYRGHLYALVNFPIPAANVPDEEAELARREDFGLVFDSAYLNRDIVCLGCHNSEFSVTDNAVDPTDDRHWPLDGLIEKAVFGASTGVEHARAHAPFRFNGFVGDDGEGSEPWGWSASCGTFYPNVGDDIAGIDGYFASLRGNRLTAYDLEGILKDGFDTLRGGELAIDEANEVADPDAAFAYLVASSVVENVWKEVIGSGLTIANYFPRNEAARDLLQQLSDDFVKNGYSLQELLVDIVTSDFFNRLPPEAGCGASAYTYPNVFDPWVISDGDEARRLNGPGDAVAAISARALMRTAYVALEWAVPEDLDFPGTGGGEPFCQGYSCGQLQNFCSEFDACCVTYENQCLGGGGGGFADELPFQTGVGAFLKNGERGFRGLDFQARLVWEDRFGACANPSTADDFVDKVVAAATASATATLEDVVAVVKDRLLGEPAIDDAAEIAAVEAILDAPLSTLASAATELEAKVRAFCGVLTSSPQFLLTAIAGKGGEVPALTPTEYRFEAICGAVEARGLGPDFTLACEGGTLTVTPEP
jgi:hypothetical protein